MQAPKRPTAIAPPPTSPSPSLSSTERFIQERKYLKNVTEKTLSWYAQSFNAFARCSAEAEYKARVIELRERGVSAISVNSYIRCVNAYLKWSGATFKLGKLQESHQILPTFSPTHIEALRKAKPHSGSGGSGYWAPCGGVVLSWAGYGLGDASGDGCIERETQLNPAARKWMDGPLRRHSLTRAWLSSGRPFS
jgi:hypothetical protein